MRLGCLIGLNEAHLFLRGQLITINITALKQSLFSIPETQSTSVVKLPLEKRLLAIESGSLAARLFKTMLEKKSNLCVAADLTTMKEILDLVENIGDKICCLKLHFDIVMNFYSALNTSLHFFVC